MTKSASLIPLERVEQAILLIRGEKVMLDMDLAAMYGVETKVLIQAVKRNKSRFPEDFMFQLDKREFERLRSQIVTSSFGISMADDNLRSRFGTSRSWGGRRYPPYAFTEQGVAMLSSVLNSPRAIQVNIEIMRAFVRLRKMLAGNEELKRKIEKLEKKYDAQFRVVFQAIRELMEPTTRKTRRIGFAPQVER